MSQSPDTQQGGAPQQSKRRGLLPPEVMDLMIAPVKVGAWSGKPIATRVCLRHAKTALKMGINSRSGTAGALAGVAGAIAKDTNPVASGIVSGAQWFALGGTFWCMCPWIVHKVYLLKTTSC